MTVLFPKFTWCILLPVDTKRMFVFGHVVALIKISVWAVVMYQCANKVMHDFAIYSDHQTQVMPQFIGTSAVRKRHSFVMARPG